QILLHRVQVQALRVGLGKLDDRRRSSGTAVIAVSTGLAGITQAEVITIDRDTRDKDATSAAPAPSPWHGFRGLDDFLWRGESGRGRILSRREVMIERQDGNE